MRVRYLEETDPMCLINGKVYEVSYIDENGMYAIKDETDEVYAYFPESFEIVEQ